MNRKHLIKTIRINIFLVLITGILMISGLPLFAEITGPCANCHIIHNSKDGKPVNIEGSKGFLLKTTGSSACRDCHARGAADSIDPLTGAPQVTHTDTPDLAGGNFAYLDGSKAGVTGDQKTRGHNIIDSGQTDDNFSGRAYPPGDEFSQSGKGFKDTTFTCAGKFGCHGDRTVEDELMAVIGSHHADDSVLKFGSIDESSQGDTAGTSYRFLLGVKGGEDADWEKTVSASDHNEYKGAVGRGSESTVTSPGGNTISGLCAECHGNFHGPGEGDISMGSLWLRHPVDIELPESGEFANYNPENSNQYSTEAPVARVTIPGTSDSTVTPGRGDTVMCLSCHRAHASPYEDILRWNSGNMIAGDSSAKGTGCFICHTGKSG